MASSKSSPPGFVFSILIIISFFNFITCNNQHILSSCNFDAIYQLGDSIADTGNDVQDNPSSKFARLPYGETFKKATGRCSDGLLMIDYIALSAGIPFLDPYLNKDGLFDYGLNFAFAGATAMSAEDLAKWNVSFVPTSISLSRQLDWMFSNFNTTCHGNKDCFKKNGKALFMVGEIGGNDYNYAFWQGKTIEEVKTMVPEVVETIKQATKRVIGYGATRLVVPGNFPIGCFPVYLTKYQTNDATAYDELHCLKELNNFSIYHNDLLQQAIAELKEEHPDETVVYGDYYNAFLWLLSKADLLGFDPTSLQKACCGIGGDYNYGLSSWCGDPKVPVCENPNERLSWDGVHLTQRAYELMATWLVRDIYPKLQCEYIVSYSSAV
ncbi:GDSL esterase/lipase At5g03980 isoform X1 [Gossypium raimondii]|nr:GDSL esterase/lipase At5g03980 isoform X1 [Gossypium raimondii]